MCSAKVCLWKHVARNTLPNQIVSRCFLGQTVQLFQMLLPSNFTVLTNLAPNALNLFTNFGWIFTCTSKRNYTPMHRDGWCNIWKDCSNTRFPSNPPPDIQMSWETCFPTKFRIRSPKKAVCPRIATLSHRSQQRQVSIVCFRHCENSTHVFRKWNRQRNAVWRCFFPPRLFQFNGLNSVILHVYFGRWVLRVLFFPILQIL